MKKFQHIVEYYSLVIFAFLVRLLPLPVGRFLVRRLADFVYYVVPIRKDVVIGNLTMAFGKEKSETELRKIARDTYRQFAQTMVELLYYPAFDSLDIAKLVTIENRPLLDSVEREGKGAVLVGAHFGNWELMGAALALYYPVTFVVGQQKNTRVDDLLNSYRLSKGIKIVPLKMALRGVLRALRKNEFVAILADQDAHGDGAFVDFFGTPASTPRGPALFALKAGCPLIVGSIVRENGRFRAFFEVVPKPEPSGDEGKDVETYTAAFTKIIERFCREHPDHWFWMHRRWKTKR